MKRRLRKKLHLGEFAEYGFEIQASVPIDRSEALVDDLIGACDEADREAVRAWFTARADASDVRVGPLVDAWR